MIVSSGQNILTESHQVADYLHRLENKLDVVQEELKRVWAIKTIYEKRIRYAMEGFDWDGFGYVEDEEEVEQIATTLGLSVPVYISLPKTAEEIEYTCSCRFSILATRDELDKGLICPNCGCSTR